MKTDLYKQATNLNQMAVFEWNILEDTLDFDEMMKILIQHDIPKTEAKKKSFARKMDSPRRQTRIQKSSSKNVEHGNCSLGTF